MQTLELFSRHQRTHAALGFLLGSLILPGLSLLVFGLFSVLPNANQQIYMMLIILPFGLMSAALGIGGFFWTLGQLSVWSARGYRLASTCMWIWIGTACAVFATELLLGRSLDPVNLLVIGLLVALRPKPGGGAWSWPMISLLERQEAWPFRWGLCAALGFQVMATSLSVASPHASPHAAPVLTGPAGFVMGSLAALTMGFVLGATAQAWTKQRWPAQLVSVLVLIAATIAFALRNRIPVWISITPWAAAAWSLGLLSGDFAAAHERPELLAPKSAPNPARS